MVMDMASTQGLIDTVEVFDLRFLMARSLSYNLVKSTPYLLVFIVSLGLKNLKKF